MRRVESETMYPHSWLLELASTAKDRVVEFKKLHGRTASDVMTKDVIHVPPDLTLVEVARVLNWYGIKHVPVVDEQEKLIGIISRADLIRNLAEHDPQAPQDPVRKEEFAARRQAAKDAIASSTVKPYLVNAFVEDDQVDLFGLIQSQADAKVLAQEILSLPGVSKVKTDRLREISDKNLYKYS